MLELIHYCGFDTGFSNDTIFEYKVEKKGGLEYISDWFLRQDIIHPEAIKQPTLNGRSILFYAIKNNWKPKKIIFCVREINEILDSLVSFQSKRTPSYYNGFQDYKLLVDTEEKIIKYKEKTRKDILASYHKFLLECAEFDVSPIIVKYPRYALDFEYLASKLDFIDKEKLKKAITKIKE
jgi:hypothetical protein